ncbi:MAG: ribonuclease HII [Dehalococcoidia bacterium]|nr:MAG: ribonuclease HII [Dehalococcoidia bacterium]
MVATVDRLPAPSASRRVGPRPGWAVERSLWREGLLRVAGVDEVGRGSLAGPVVAAAVVLPRTRSGVPCRAGWIRELDDSKILTARQRERLAAVIRAECEWNLAAVSPQVIDQVNILQATRLAMRRAVAGLPARPAALIIDGNEVAGSGLPERSVVHADARCVSVAAASIIAKVARDAMMEELDQVFPGYGFAEHKGYATDVHRAAIARLGPTTVHRLSFAPVREAFFRVSGRAGRTTE